MFVITGDFCDYFRFLAKQKIKTVFGAIIDARAEVLLTNKFQKRQQER